MVDAKDGDGQTPLGRAAENGHSEVVQLLLTAHAEIDVQDYAGKTPITRATEGYHSKVRELLEQEAVRRLTVEARHS